MLVGSFLLPAEEGRGHAPIPFRGSVLVGGIAICGMHAVLFGKNKKRRAGGGGGGVGVHGPVAATFVDGAIGQQAFLLCPPPPSSFFFLATKIRLAGPPGGWIVRVGV